MERRRNATEQQRNVLTGSGMEMNDVALAMQGTAMQGTEVIRWAMAQQGRVPI